MADRTFHLSLLALTLLCIAAALGLTAIDATQPAFIVALTGLGLVIGLLLKRMRGMSLRKRERVDLHAQLKIYQKREQRLFRQLRDVVEAAGSLADAVILLDTHGRVRWFNLAAVQLLGVKSTHVGHPLIPAFEGSEFADWLKTTHIHNLTENTDANAQPEAQADANAQPETQADANADTDTDENDDAYMDAGAKAEAEAKLRASLEAHIDMKAPADPSRHVSLTLMPFGERQHIILGRDISALSRLEKVRRDFVSNVSHELRTPLTVIYGYLELMDPSDAESLAPMISEMRMQSQRMRQIVEDLLILSRLETGEALPEETIDMLPVLEALRAEAEALSRGKHNISVEVGTTAQVRGSKHHLHSAFSNLVSNATRYTPDGGNIVIRWKITPSGDAEFSVQDSGIGIAPDQRNRLTERFYRVSSSRSRDSGGTGLGLSIVKHVLNLHQSRLEIDSELGKGSTFICILDASRVISSQEETTHE